MLDLSAARFNVLDNLECIGLGTDKLNPSDLDLDFDNKVSSLRITKKSVKAAKGYWRTVGTSTGPLTITVKKGFVKTT